jgi:hypothetical protein
MDRIPTELISHIFSFACTDDGSTARSLRLASKYHAAIAEPYRFQSVAVAGPAQIEHLVLALERAPAPQRRVRYLLVADQTAARAADGFPAPLARGGDGALPAHAGFFFQAALMRCAREALRFSELVHRLAALVAPALESLACLVFNPYSVDVMQAALAFRFPRLRELALRLSTWPSRAIQPPLPLEVRMPNLRRFRLGAACELAQTFPIVDLVFGACPALADLHLCDVQFTSQSRTQLLGMIGARHPDDSAAAPVDIPRASDRLRRMTVHASAEEGLLNEQDTAGGCTERASSASAATRLDVIPQIDGRWTRECFMEIWLNGDKDFSP